MNKYLKYGSIILTAGVMGYYINKITSEYTITPKKTIQIEQTEQSSKLEQIVKQDSTQAIDKAKNDSIKQANYQKHLIEKKAHEKYLKDQARQEFLQDSLEMHRYDNVDDPVSRLRDSIEKDGDERSRQYDEDLRESRKGFVDYNAQMGTTTPKTDTVYIHDNVTTNDPSTTVYIRLNHHNEHHEHGYDRGNRHDAPPQKQPPKIVPLHKVPLGK